jgi:hypothetical protein
MGAPMASMFGPTAQGAALLGSFAPQVTPTLATIGADAIAGAAPTYGMPALGSGAGLAETGSNLTSLRKAQKLFELAKGNFDDSKKPAPQPMQRPQAAPTNESEIQALLKRLYGSNTWA